jgi:oxaloacetate decarboxylase alpha subunit
MAPAPFNAELQARVLNGAEAVTCRPADLLDAEMDKLTAELKGIASEKGIRLAADVIDDVLTYALFPQIGLKFLENRDNPAAFEPVPNGKPAVARDAAAADVYSVEVNGQSYVVKVSEGGDIEGIKPVGVSAAATPAVAPVGAGEPQLAPLAGNIFKVMVQPGQAVEADELVIILEAMKMETEIRAFKAGTVGAVNVKVGDMVAVGDSLLTIG